MTLAATVWSTLDRISRSADGGNEGLELSDASCVVLGSRIDVMFDGGNIPDSHVKRLKGSKEGLVEQVRFGEIEKCICENNKTTTTGSLVDRTPLGLAEIGSAGCTFLV